MNALRKLIPQALQRYDLHLQQSMPRLWATRIHYHLWFLLLLNALLFCFGMLLRVDRRSFPDPEEFFGWMIVPAILYFAFWIYKVVLFTVERRNGLRHPFAEVGEFLVHMVSIALIFSLPFTIGLTLAWRIDRIVGDEQFVAEVDALNKEAFLFIDGNGRVYDGWEQEYNYSEGYSSSSHQYFRDLAEYKDRRNSDPEKPKALDQIYSEYVTAFNEAAFGSSETLDPHKANYYKPKIDSIQNNFPFYFVEHGPFTPGDQYYNFDMWSGSEYIETPFLNDSLLEVHYVASLGTPNEIDRDRIANALAIADTYYRDTSGCTVDSVIAQFKDRVRSTSRIHRANRQLEGIWDAKTLDYEFAHFWLMFYIVVISSFCLALLIGIFKNIYWQPFLISIVVCILVPILILCLSYLFTYNSEYGDGPNPGNIMLYTHYLIGVLLVVLAPFILLLKAYRTSLAVTTIIANCIVPFIAVITLQILHYEFDIFGEDALYMYIERLRAINHLDIRLPALNAELDLLREKIATITQIFLWGGMALYLFVLHGFFRTLLARLVSMPERK